MLTWSFRGQIQAFLKSCSIGMVQRALFTNLSRALSCSFVRTGTLANFPEAATSHNVRHRQRTHQRDGIGASRAGSHRCSGEQPLTSEGFLSAALRKTGGSKGDRMRFHFVVDFDGTVTLEDTTDVESDLTAALPR